MAKQTAEMAELFQAPAQIMKLETMADGGIRIQIDTSEMTDPDELAKLFRLKKGSQGWFLFKNSQVVVDDVPIENPQITDGPEEKTPSQRLRAVLFVYWKETRDGKGSFEDFYRVQMEKFIDVVKGKLPTRDGYSG